MKKLLFTLAIAVGIFTGFAIADYLDSQKLNFVSRLTKLAENSIALQKEAALLNEIYFNNGYNSGGANELVAGDLTGSSYEGLPIANITSGVTYAQELGKLFGNQAVAQADYLTTVTNLASIGSE